MTQDQTTGMLLLLSQSYPHSFKNISELDAEMLVKTWTEILRDYEWETIKQVVVNWISTQDYAPTISQIRREYENYKNAEIKDKNKINFDSLRKQVEKEEKYHASLRKQYTDLGDKDQKTIQRMIERKKMQNKYISLYPEIIEISCIEAFFKQQKG